MTVLDFVAESLDFVVRKTKNWPPLVVSVLGFLLYPLIRWRLKDIAHILARECRFLPATSWTDVEKHGKNVVYAKKLEKNIWTKKQDDLGTFVVDYENKTIRLVTGVPEEKRAVGETF